MRTRLAWFLLGSIVTLWANAYTDELGLHTVTQLLDGGGPGFNYDTINEALVPLGQAPTPVDEDVDEEEEPAGPNWLNEATPPFRPA